MVPSQARYLALSILTVTETATSENTLVDFLVHKVGMSDKDVRAALAEFRRHRDQLANSEPEVQGRMLLPDSDASHE